MIVNMIAAAEEWKVGQGRHDEEGDQRTIVFRDPIVHANATSSRAGYQLDTMNIQGGRRTY